MSNTALAPSDLLLAFDACVRRDAAVSGMRGRIRIGVRGRNEDAWWQVTFDREAHTELTSDAAGDADAVMLMSEDVADALLHLRPLPPDRMLEVSGDRSLLGRFLDRYLTQTSWLHVRTEAARKFSPARRARAARRIAR